MLHEKIYLGKQNSENSYMTTYILDDIVDNQSKRPMIFIFPGGGYESCVSREGELIARMK